MKVLGHAWTAVKVFPTREREKLVWGAVLPEMMFYVENNPFSYEEIHEGGDVALQWARTVSPAWIDLGCGMMTHSVKYGADFFNELDWLKRLGYDKERDQEFDMQVARALGVDLETARVRVHNILDLALEVYLAREHPEIREWLDTSFVRVPLGEVAHTVATIFKKSEKQAELAIAQLQDKIRPETLTDTLGIARMWCRFSQSLPEQKVEEEKVVDVINLAIEKIRGNEEIFIDQVIKRTKTRAGTIS